MVNQIVNQISEFAYESVKSKKLNKVKVNEILDIFVFIIGCVFSQFCIKRRENSQF